MQCVPHALKAFSKVGQKQGHSLLKAHFTILYGHISKNQLNCTKILTFKHTRRKKWLQTYIPCCKYFTCKPFCCNRLAELRELNLTTETPHSNLQDICFWNRSAGNLERLCPSRKNIPLKNLNIQSEKQIRQ